MSLPEKSKHVCASEPSSEFSLNCVFNSSNKASPKHCFIVTFSTISNIGISNLSSNVLGIKLFSFIFDVVYNI